MELTIYQCDKCKADCSAYEKRVVVNFPFGEHYDLCIKCARELFPEKKEDEVVGKKRILESLPLLNERELTLIWRDTRRAADVYAMDDNDKAWNECLDLENAIENECEKRFGSRPASYKSLEGANELPGIYKKIYSIQRKEVRDEDND